MPWQVKVLSKHLSSSRVLRDVNLQEFQSSHPMQTLSKRNFLSAKSFSCKHGRPPGPPSPDLKENVYLKRLTHCGWRLLSSSVPACSGRRRNWAVYSSSQVMSPAAGLKASQVPVILLRVCSVQQNKTWNPERKISVFCYRNEDKLYKHHWNISNKRP